MSESTTQRRPSSVETFKQKHEAYAIAREAPDLLWRADNATNFGYYSEAKKFAEEITKAADTNPHARRMLDPKLVEDAREYAKDATANLKNEVRIISEKGWDTSDTAETRLSIGKSERGYHYMLEIGSLPERPDIWSAPFRTEAAAESAGRSIERREHGQARHPEREEITPRQMHTQSLQRAKELRQMAGDGLRSPEGKAKLIERAKACVAQAGMRRTYGQAMTRAMSAAPKPKQANGLSM